MSDIVIFEGDAQPVEVRLEGETLWLTLQQIADLFGRDKSVVSRHLGNVFASGELEREAVVAKNATTAADGKTYQVEYFNLDAIISVGYRVNSSRATRFRQWATRVLREHLSQGYSLNQHRLAQQGLTELEQAVALLGQTLGREDGLIGTIFRKAQSKLSDPAKLKRLVSLIDREGPWIGLGVDVKGEIYEGLLEKNAAEVKSGAGQYFTPRPVIEAIVLEQFRSVSLELAGAANA